ncbi:unnamed protein product [Coffea canephora]|uniref:Uncharacterized protein n=1 Tax=Coffea canephora TaxID=49390 RepID=A0A068V9D8_COFCA|nr:unnamed protein product [Coffea canephora]
MVFPIVVEEKEEVRRVLGGIAYVIGQRTASFVVSFLTRIPRDRSYFH